MRAWIWLGAALLLAAPSSAAADSGSITNVHPVAGGQVEATYAATSTYCTSFGYCGYFPYASQVGVSEACDARNTTGRLTYVGGVESAAGTQTRTKAFYPQITGALKLCLHLHQGDDREITVAEYVYTPPTEPQAATQPTTFTARSKVAPLTIADARASLTSVLRNEFGARFRVRRNLKRDCYRLLASTVRCRVRWDHKSWRYSGVVDMKNDSADADSLLYTTKIRRKRVKITSAPKPSRSSPQPTKQPSPSAGSGCNPNYSGACLPLTGDVDCTEISATDFSVVGSDPFRLDGDNDGVACES